MPETSASNLAELLGRCRNGDAGAWEALFDWSHAILNRELDRRLPRRHAVRDDIVEKFEERLLQVVERAQIRGTSDGEIAAYVIQIARTSALDGIEAFTRRRREPLDRRLPDPGLAPDEVLAERQRQREQREREEATRRLVEAFLAGLAPKDRYLMLAKQDGVAAKEIADKLEELFGERVTPQTVDSRYSKLRKKLRASVNAQLRT